ncbi:MAG: hypothetical protein F6J93_07805 [Oscillatoria sp. SIO1A7]|nr:hypothetical protein [Oscillatoria sp. SIO1A7]
MRSPLELWEGWGWGEGGGWGVWGEERIFLESHTLHKRVLLCGVWGVGKPHAISRPLSGARKSYRDVTTPYVTSVVNKPQHPTPYTLHPTPYTPYTLHPNIVTASVNRTFRRFEKIFSIEFAKSSNLISP